MLFFQRQAQRGNRRALPLSLRPKSLLMIMTTSSAHPFRRRLFLLRPLDPRSRKEPTPSPTLNRLLLLRLHHQRSSSMTFLMTPLIRSFSLSRLPQRLLRPPRSQRLRKPKRVISRLPLRQAAQTMQSKRLQPQKPSPTSRNSSLATRTIFFRLGPPLRPKRRL